MSSNMQGNHRIPRIYKEAAKILEEVVLSKRGLKDVIYSNRNRTLHKKFVALIDKYLDNQNSINKFIVDSKLKDNVKNEFMAKILCTELMFGRKCLPSIENNTIIRVNKIFEEYSESAGLNNHIPRIPETIFDCDKDSPNQNFIAAKKKLRYVRINTLMISKDQLIERLVQDGLVLLPRAQTYDEFLAVLKEHTSEKRSQARQIGGTWERNARHEQGYEDDWQRSTEFFIEDFHLEDVLVFLQHTEFHNYPLYKNGSLFLQDKASCIPTHLLAPPPNSVVFDTCAAPGNKTLHLAAFMGNQGKIYAVDKDPKRFKYLQDVVKLAQGDQIIETIQSDIFDIRMAEYEDVEYVLVDPSCSGSGITERQKIDNHSQISSSRVKNLSGFQKDLLNRVCSYFPNVKRIVYCTCSVQEEENEQVVDEILAKHENKFEVEDLTQHPILKEWKHFGKSNYKYGEKCFYALPNDYCTGFFAAVLNRKNPGNAFDLREQNGSNNYHKIDTEMRTKRGKFSDKSEMRNSDRPLKQENILNNDYEDAHEESNNKFSKKRKGFELDDDALDRTVVDNQTETNRRDLVEDMEGGCREGKKKRKKLKDLENSEDKNKIVESNQEVEEKCKIIGNKSSLNENVDQSAGTSKKEKKRKHNKMVIAENSAEQELLESTKEKDKLSKKEKKKKAKSESQLLKNNPQMIVTDVEEDIRSSCKKIKTKEQNGENILKEEEEAMESDQEKPSRKEKKKSKRENQLVEQDARDSADNIVLNESENMKVLGVIKKSKKKRKNLMCVSHDFLLPVSS